MQKRTILKLLEGAGGGGFPRQSKQLTRVWPWNNTIDLFTTGSMYLEWKSRVAHRVHLISKSRYVTPGIVFCVKCFLIIYGEEVRKEWDN